MPKPTPNRMKTLLQFVLLLSLLFYVAETAAQYAPDVRFEDEVIPSGTYEATVSVSARNATVQSGSAVTFRAGQTVRLEAGFKAELGATFRAEVDPDVGSGGGGLVLSNLPPHLPNSRFEYEDVFKNEIVRPGLSVRGFDATRFADNGDLGLGLKQILERVYDEDERDALTREAFAEIVELADSTFNFAVQLPRGEVERNTRVLQARAFVALVMYVLEQNGNDIQALNNQNPDIQLPLTHAAAIAALREPWTLAGGAIHFRVNRYADRANVDVMKWARSLMMLARAAERPCFT